MVHNKKKIRIILTLIKEKRTLFDSIGGSLSHDPVLRPYGFNGISVRYFS